MSKSFILLFLTISILISCNKRNDEIIILNFAVFFEPVCLQPLITLCVSEDEYVRIKEIFLANQNGDELDCLPVTVIDLEGTLHEGFLRGYAATRNDIPCD